MLERWSYVAMSAAGTWELRTPAVESARVVLVVENTTAVAHVVAALLESEGYGVLIARTLPVGLAVAAAVPISLVIADSFATTAREALDRLSGLRQASAPAPVLLFTGHRDVAEPAVLAAGYAGLLPKPFDIDDLLERVGRAIDGRAATA
jgi:DNA-binding response OmpR family regulator